MPWSFDYENDMIRLRYILVCTLYRYMGMFMNTSICSNENVWKKFYWDIRWQVSLTGLYSFRCVLLSSNFCMWRTRRLEILLYSEKVILKAGWAAATLFSDRIGCWSTSTAFPGWPLVPSVPLVPLVPCDSAPSMSWSKTRSGWEGAVYRTQSLYSIFNYRCLNILYFESIRYIHPTLYREASALLDAMNHRGSCKCPLAQCLTSDVLWVRLVLVKADVGRVHPDDGLIQQTERLLHMLGVHLRRRATDMFF